MAGDFSATRKSGRTVGVLALQGAFAQHQKILEQSGVSVVQVRRVADFDGLDGLVLPGGESTVISKLLTSNGLVGPLNEAIQTGLPIFGTCAGMILLASRIRNGTPDQITLDAIDIEVERNSYGRQVDSFEAGLQIGHDTDLFQAVFIRAPKVTRVGAGVEVVAEHDGAAVLCRSGSVMVSSFHPELTDDPRVHHLFLEML